MQVFVDSNQFIADFLMEGAPFRYLAHVLNTSGHTLLVSRLVIEEVDNKFMSEAHKAIADATKSRQRLAQLGLPTGVDSLKASAVPPLDLEVRLRELFESVAVVEYGDVPHAEVVRRALERRKPFDAEGHVGYRDTLLWCSFVRWLVKGTEGASEELIFISSNWRDFYQSAPGKEAATVVDREKPSGGKAKKQGARLGVSFHGDLLADLKGTSKSVTPYFSVAAFLETKTDRRTHIIDHDKRYEFFEDFLEDNGLGVLRRLDEENAAVVLQTVFPPAVASALTVVSSDAEISEGVEDLDIVLAEPSGRDVYVDCNFDLRIVNVDLFVPQAQFDAHRAEIESASHVWEVSHLDDTVAIRLSLRAYYQASFNFDPKTLECSGFYLHTFAVR